jgi:hypothetical protein
MTHQLGGLFCLLAGCVLIAIYAYARGFEDGYQTGWRSAEEWIVKLESEVDAERVKIWRGEG